jgi:hypothetical protein
MAVKTLVDDPRWESFVDDYALDLTRFALEVCDMSPTPQQVELFDSISKYGSRTSVRSGHGTGKSRSIGVAAIWHLLCYYLSNTMITAPKIEQVRNVSWKEITDLQGIIRSGPQAWIADYFSVEAERVYVNGFKQQWFIIAKTAPRGSPENLAGMHRDFYLVIADEASGIPDANYSVLTGALTDARNRMLLTSQPTRPSGFFYDTHHSLSTNEGGVWTSIAMNSEESPLVSLDFCREKKAEYTDAEYTIKVKGEFPEDSDGNLLGRKAIEACFGRSVLNKDDSYGIVVSIDVGAGEYRDKSIALVAHVNGYGDFGDEARRVQIVAIPVMSNTRNIQDFSGDCFAISSSLENCTTLVDAGGMGIAVCQNLETLGLPEVKRVKWGGPCFAKKNRERFFNLRAQAMVCAARAVKEGRVGIIDGPWRKDMLDQASRIPYHFDEKARYKIESKEDMRKNGLPSPDLWDALSQIFLEDVNYMIAENSGSNSFSTAASKAKSEAESLFADVV